VNPVTLRKILGSVTHPRMCRAWRNRSNVTRWQWEAFARQVLEESGPGSGIDFRKLAACLYVACGWYAARSGSDTFDGAAVPTRGWLLIGLMTEDFLECTPDRALTRGAWEEQRKQEAAVRKAARKGERNGN